MNKKLYSLLILAAILCVGPLSAQQHYHKWQHDFGPQPSVNAITQQLALWFPVLAQTQSDLVLQYVKQSQIGRAHV